MSRESESRYILRDKVEPLLSDSPGNWVQRFQSSSVDAQRAIKHLLRLAINQNQQLNMMNGTGIKPIPIDHVSASPAIWPKAPSSHSFSKSIGMYRNDTSPKAVVSGSASETYSFKP